MIIMFINYYNLETEFLSFLPRVSPAKPQPTITTLFLSIFGMFIMMDTFINRIQNYSFFT